MVIIQTKTRTKQNKDQSRSGEFGICNEDGFILCSEVGGRADHESN